MTSDPVLRIGRPIEAGLRTLGRWLIERSPAESVESSRSGPVAERVNRTIVSSRPTTPPAGDAPRQGEVSRETPSEQWVNVTPPPAGNEATEDMVDQAEEPMAGSYEQPLPRSLNAARPFGISDDRHAERLVNLMATPAPPAEEAAPAGPFGRPKQETPDAEAVVPTAPSGPSSPEQEAPMLTELRVAEARDTEPPPVPESSPDDAAPLDLQLSPEPSPAEAVGAAAETMSVSEAAPPGDERPPAVAEQIETPLDEGPADAQAEEPAVVAGAAAMESAAEPQQQERETMTTETLEARTEQQENGFRSGTSTVDRRTAVDQLSKVLEHRWHITFGPDHLDESLYKAIDQLIRSYADEYRGMAEKDWWKQEAREIVDDTNRILMDVLTTRIAQAFVSAPSEFAVASPTLRRDLNVDRERSTR